VCEITPPVCDYEGSDYQESFWDHGSRAYEDRVEEIALRRMLPGGGQRLLELGAGAGRNTHRYKGFNQIVLLDYARTQLEKARDRLGDGPGYIYVAADVYRLPFAPGVFDAATMIRTIHHMADSPRALKQIQSVLMKDAAFILEFANKRNVKAIARWLLRRQDWNPFDRRPVEFAALNFDFHPAEMRAWLTDTGFDIERQLTVSHFRINFLKRMLPINLLVGLDAAAQLTGDLWQLSPSVFIKSHASLEKELLRKEVFWKCPACGSIDLGSEDAGLLCAGCGSFWQKKDGIYDFKEPAPTRR
jgi:ubiquinone/menaquinone biosynthesis C-methylase UbiE